MYIIYTATTSMPSRYNNPVASAFKNYIYNKAGTQKLYRTSWCVLRELFNFLYKL